ncbi:dihydrodipicolinate synthase family protein [Prauserella flavalba]|uniref:Dihydrodipicolinate synthase family protein n=1 Tax=Prauserella flavalba TaxID=1477506 RepID=A0A318LJG3_9PSEU|nr:dihydrodipicolinate synthase family protein [Prauserella flavalba]
MVSDSGLSLHGVIPPLVTPLDERGEVDRRSLERLVACQLDAGVDGVFVGGSSGEVALLDTAQRRTVVEVTVGAVAGAVPVLAGAVDTGTRRVIEHARQAAELGADAVVVTAPFYVKPHPAEIVAHFRHVHAAVDVPVVAYDIPSAVGARLTPDVVVELAESKDVVALKDSSGDLATFREILRRTGLPALSGSELLADTAVLLGAAGLVPGLGNVDPHGYVRLYRAARDGDAAAAAAEQDRLARLFGIVSVADLGRVGFTAGALGAFKAAMALRGIIDCPATNRPLAPLSPSETETIAEILAAEGLGKL